MSHTVIVGGGYSGVLSAVTLMNLASDWRPDGPRDEITLVEKTAALGGVAYSSVTADAFHETNIAARNLGLTSDPWDFTAATNLRADKIVPRREVGQFLVNELERARWFSEDQINFSQSSVDIVDAEEKNDKVVLSLADGRTMQADNVILATGNVQLRELPCIDGKLKSSASFKDHFVANQWSERQKIRDIPHDQPVLIVGTALSGYDAARSLLRQGHRGRIMLASRHALEHFEYPENFVSNDITLPRPRFLQDILFGSEKRAVKSLTQEFLDLTGIKLDLAEGTFEHEGWLANKFHGRKNYTSEQVLKQWEKHLPEIVAEIGEEKLGKILQRFSSLIAVLRVGAGHSVCEEIKEAQKTGQLSVVAADIDHISENADGLIVEMNEGGRKRALRFHTVISSLGPDNDYRHTDSPLWKKMFERGYTAPHPVGIGVTIDNRWNYGRLPGCRHVFAAGVCASGSYMIDKGMIGPPCFSIPGMRDRIVKTAEAVSAQNAAINRTGTFAPAQGGSKLVVP